MNVADLVAKQLGDRGVRHVFELSGGMITLLLDALYGDGRVEIVSVHHEQAAAFAAEASGRMTGVPGVALATSGPGATNLLTGIGSCFFDSSPAVFITGQVNRSEQKGARAVRQLGFQETDIVAMAAPITKAAWRVTSPEEVVPLLERAFHLAVSGRPGPVLLDIPMDVQKANADNLPASPVSLPIAEEPMDLSAVGRMLESLRRSRRPLILAGGGIRTAGAIAGFRAFAEALRVPVVHSLMGVDLLPYEDPRRIGMIGSYGNRWANVSLAEADFLLVLGSRLDIRQTGADTTAFKGNREIFQVDCDRAEVNNRVTGCEEIIAPLGPFFEYINRQLPAEPWLDTEGWLTYIQALRLRTPDTSELAGVSGINPNILVHQISKSFQDAAAYVVDVGQHQMWAAQSIELSSGQRFLTSGGMGAMGFSLPAAVGAAFALPGKQTVLIAGDGGFQCNIQELQTVARNKLNLKMIILNNLCHGMVRQFQESYLESRFQSTVWGYDPPDFTAVSNAYQIPARTVSDPSAVGDQLRWLAEGDGPGLLQVMIDPSANAYPKIAFGRPISEMEPDASPIAMEST